MTTGLTIVGTNHNDDIIGTDGDDVINGRNGNDLIAGLAGNDIITDGNGNNTISDGDGNDSITSGNGNNTITVGNGTDTITVGNGNNVIVAGNGANTITTGNGANTITTGSGNDVIHTGNGADHINSGGGSDQISAGGGNDVVVYNMTASTGSHDVFDGGLGTDTLQLELTHQQFSSAAVQADLAAYNAFLAQNANPATFNGPSFHFTAFDLTVSNFETVNIVFVNSPVVITSGPESNTVAEQANMTGSAATDTTPTTPAGTLNFTDADTGDTHTVSTHLASTSIAVPAATQADFATALTTVLHDSTGTGNGSIDWNFAIPDKDLDFLSQGQTLAVDYNVSVSDGLTTSTQTVELDITGANDPVTITSGPQSGSVTEQPNITGSTSLDSTTPVPTGTMAFKDVDLADMHSVNVAVDSVVWSVDPSFVPAQTFSDLQSALTTALHDSTGASGGSIDWNFAIPDQDLDFLSNGETLTATYDVIVSDGLSSSTQTVTITMNGADDPVLATPASVDVTDFSFAQANTVVAAGGLADITHPVDLSSPRSITEVNGSAANVGHAVDGTYGTLFLSADGTYTYVANSAFDALQVGENPTDQFTFTESDTHGNTSTSTLTFNITGGNDAPVITAATASASITEDAGPSVMVNGDFETGDLTGWTTSGSHIVVLPFDIGGPFGNFTALLEPTSAPESLSQNISTTPGEHYFVSFDVIGDPESLNDPLTVSWDGVDVLSLSSVPAGVNHYSFDVVGDASASTTALQFTYADDTDGMFLDSIQVNPATGPATEQAAGSISFSDAETADTHTASFIPLGTGYLGTFSLDPVSETSGNGSVGWHFTVNNADIQFLAAGQTLTQDYLVSVTDNLGESAIQDVSVTLTGTNDAPTAVGETVVTDAGANGTVDIPTWALTSNDTDPDTADHLSISHIVSATGGTTSNNATDVFFFDDAIQGGSFDYQTTDGIAVSNTATATIVNNASNASTLTAAASGDSILIATNGTESLQGGSGNDILIGNSGSHTMSGGGGNDTFAFLHATDGPGIITDFNNTTEHDHIAISASGYGGGLTAGMDVSSIFETSNDNQFSGSGAEFHFDTANETLYFSSNGTQANAIAVTSVQNGVVLNPHDILVV